MTLAGHMERGHLQPMTALSLNPAQVMLATLALLLVMTDCAPALMDKPIPCEVIGALTVSFINEEKDNGTEALGVY